MNLEILKGIVIIFALSTLVNLLFTRFRVPTVIGYLLTGVISGPHLLSLAGGQNEIEVLSEIGVVLLLFTIGLEFSLQHLLKIRKVVFLGGFIQVFLTAGVFFIVSNFYDVTWQSAIFLSFLVALSSSALVLKLLQERSEITSNYGRTVLGILIFQDLLLVPLLLFTELLSENTVNISRELLVLSAKVIIIIGMVYAGNRWIMPRLLHVIALTRNQELFIMSVFLICFGIALFTSWLGMSLAFGAFLAGLMISESDYSHNIFGNFLPIKDIFTSFFFVSIGMLLDLSFIADNTVLVLTTVILVLVLKSLIAGGTGFLLGHTLHGTILIGLALSQVGEFSFLLAKLGLEYSILPDFYYQLFLAVAVITMASTPFLFRISLPVFNLLMKLPLPAYLVKGLFPLEEISIPEFKNHLVIIGKDGSAVKLAAMARANEIEHISIIFEPSLARERMKQGDIVVYGDAVNEPVLRKAHADTAGIVVISVGSVIPSLNIIEKIRSLNPGAYILVRSHLIQHVGQLYKAGADQVLPEKLEIAIDFLNRILVRMMLPPRDIHRILTTARINHLGVFSEKDVLNKSSFPDELSNMKISVISIGKASPAIGKTPVDIELRKKTGATILAVKRKNEILDEPVPCTIFEQNDLAYVLGDTTQLRLAHEMFGSDGSSAQSVNQ